MHFTTLFLSGLAASSAVAKRSCGTPKPNPEQSLIAQNFQLHEASARKFAFTNSTVSANTTVKVYWHVVALNKTTAGGYLAQSALDAQLQVLNDAYEPQGVAFVEAEADWTVNVEWANDEAEVPMKTALRKGTYADMNVYWVANSQYLGYAYYPIAIDVTSEEFILDGVVAVASSVPGGTAPYDLGHTLTHEAGHWFGREFSPLEISPQCITNVTQWRTRSAKATALALEMAISSLIPHSKPLPHLAAKLVAIHAPTNLVLTQSPISWTTVMTPASLVSRTARLPGLLATGTHTVRRMHHRRHGSRLRGYRCMIDDAVLYVL
jgi:hypothetical protein